MCSRCEGSEWVKEILDGKTIRVPCSCNKDQPECIFLEKQGADNKLKEYVHRPHKNQKLMKGFLNRNEKILLICGDFGRGKTTALLKLAVWHVKRRERVFYMDSAQFFNAMALSPNIPDYYELQNDIWSDMASRECHHIFIDDVGGHKRHGDIESDTFRKLLKINKPIDITSNYFLHEKDKNNNLRPEEKLLMGIYNPGCMDILNSDQCLCYETEGDSFR